MASGTHTANNSDLAFVARCSVSDLRSLVHYGSMAYQFRQHYRFGWETPSDYSQPVCLSASQSTVFPRSDAALE